MRTGARNSVVLTAFLMAALGVSSAGAADDAALAFYQGKQVRIFTMGSPGGGYDAYTRIVAAYLEKKLGAKVLPTNEPAAGGMIAMNRTVNAPPDGLTLLLTGGESLVTAQLFGLSGVNYDVRKQVWLARVSGEDKVAVVGPTSVYKAVTDMQTSGKPALWAGSGKADNNSDFTAIMCHVLGARCKIIIGYKGTGDMNLAIQRGEVDGRVISDEAAALYGPSSGMRVVTTLARHRSENFPDVPTIFEAGKLAPAQAKMIDWRAGISGLGRVILVTPGTPPERVALLRTALAEILHDPAYIAEVKKFNLAAGFASADDVRKMVEQAMGTLDDQALAEMKDIALERYYQ
ncbi:MAG: putative tricarboxylic transport rane protein [Alphaproteobacteria bacterium]|jgi:tripartite-type tricarboxylate transporter receptor subunit TctC|nr:putative tricarboxylic transport rane protein [Alphaproteobacteria bacterium]